MASKKKKNVSIARKPLDFTLLITIFILLGLGIITVLSASSPTALAETGNDSYKYVKRQLFSAVIGVILMFALSKIDYKFWQKKYKIIFLGSILLLLSTLAMGASSNGATRWVNLGFISFQPSEVAKIGIIIFYAAFLTNNKEKLKSIKEGFVYPLALIVPVVLIVLVLQNHFSATLVIVMLVSILMLLAGCRMRYFILFGLPIVAAVVFAIFFGGQGFRLQRVMTFLDPWQDKTGDGWQIINSLYAIGSGGIFGVGLGNSKQKYLYIPEPHNDFIFSVLAEELGFLGCTLVIILFAVLIWRGITISMKSPDMFGSLLAAGITSMIAIQVLINIAVVTSSMPVTGMALPFFSYGGTALIIILSAMGILLSVSRATNKA